MTVLLFTALALLILALLLLATRETRKRIATAGKEHRFHNVDVAAFRTLMNLEDEQYLRANLSPSAFRQVRRARTLAVQQYLAWIAADCGVLLQLVQTRALDQHPEPQPLIRQAIRLRFTALTLWSFLWLQYALPGIETMPRTVANRYEALREAVTAQFGSGALSGALMAH